jgi:succinate dehydrogenase/fumarate reductase flavoprotein subunit
MQLVVLAMKRLPPWLLRPFLMSFLTSILVPDASLLASGAILVNREGRRFADEIASPAAALAKQPGKYAYMLLDGRLGRKFSKWPHFVSTAPGVAYAFIPDYRRSRKDVFCEAPTLAGLGARLGMPEGSLERSIAEFNQSLASAPGSSREPFGEGPYIALGPVRHYIQFTDSGIAVDEKLRILGARDRPIANLFGAGFLGMGGALLWGHGHHLGWAFTSGRLAGRHAAHLARSPDLATDGRAARS